jgi:hypothetical protein
MQTSGASRRGKAELRLRTSTQTHSSCPGLTRASIDFEKASWKGMDCRVKPGNDEVKLNPAR